MPVNVFMISFLSEEYSVEPILVLPGHIHYVVLKGGSCVFCLEHIVSEPQGAHWASVGHAVVEEGISSLINGLGTEIETHYKSRVQSYQPSAIS